MPPVRPPLTALRQRMREDMQLRSYSPNTIDGYLRSVAQFAKHFRTAPDRLGPEESRTYQLFLIQQQVSRSTFIQTVCALRFFYEKTLGQPWMVEHIPYPRRQKTLPLVLSQAEVAALLVAPRNLKHRAILATLYATGLRASELSQLQPADIESQRMVIRVRQGKGQRDRLAMLPPRLLAVLRHYWKLYRPQTWLFPGPNLTHPITPDGVWFICRQAGKLAGLTKVVHPHLLRHNPAYLLMRHTPCMLHWDI